MSVAAVSDSLLSMRLLLVAAVLGGCGKKTTEGEAVPEPALLGTYSPATAEQLSKSCRGSLSWNATDSVLCIVSAEKPRRYYSVHFDANGLVDSISFTGLERPEIQETFDRALSPIVNASVRDALRSSILTLGPTTAYLAGNLLGSAKMLEIPDGTTPLLLIWHYSPVPADHR